MLLLGGVYTRALKTDKKRLAKKFNFTYRYIDIILSLSNSKFTEMIDLIYPYELEIKVTA